MSEARRMTIGYEGPQRRRRSTSTKLVSDLTLLRRMLQAAHPDLETFADVLERVSQTENRETSVYMAAKRRYLELAGPYNRDPHKTR
jgi:hypothetical protein